MKRNIKSKKKVLLGMSGGVDSSVAAYLLKKQGWNVLGVSLKMWADEKDNAYALSKNYFEIKNICKILGIPHYIFNVEENFKKYVVNYFISEYNLGRTPNPCVICNRYVKFRGLLDKAKELDIEYIATGHYALIDIKEDRYLLKKGKDRDKDQSYFLYNLSQQQLSHTVFPLGKYTKSKVRDIAKRMKLPVASKPDSQDICFISNSSYKAFIERESKKPIPKGEVVDLEGNILGYHNGISKYTIGQRRGLGISAKTPMYVVNIDKESNRVILGSNENLLSRELIASNLNWIYINGLEKEMQVKVKIRYGAKESNATISPIGNNRVKVVFEKEQRAITKGQATVFYKGSYVIGGGIIY